MTFSCTFFPQVAQQIPLDLPYKNLIWIKNNSLWHQSVSGQDCLKAHLSSPTKQSICSRCPRDHLLNKEVECRNLAAHAFLHVFSFSLRRICDVFYPTLKKENLEITEHFVGSQLCRTGGASAVTGGEHGVTYVRWLLALCKNEDKFPLWMFIFLFMNKDHLKAGKSLPLISVVACDLSCLHLSKQNRNRNFFASKSQDKITY